MDFTSEQLRELGLPTYADINNDLTAERKRLCLIATILDEQTERHVRKPGVASVFVYQCRVCREESVAADRIEHAPRCPVGRIREVLREAVA